jgi:hypothetical protein
MFMHFFKKSLMIDLLLSCPLPKTEHLHHLYFSLYYFFLYKNLKFSLKVYKLLLHVVINIK